MNGKAIFFDAGFTLLEPRAPVARIYHETAHQLGCAPDRAAFDAHFDRTWPRASEHFRTTGDDLATSDALEREAWRRFTREIARPFDALARRHDVWLERLFDVFDDPATWRPIPGALDAVAGFAAAGWTVGVVSNWHSALHGILDATGFAGHCRFVLASVDAGRKKPHRAIFETALRRAGVGPADAVHVGDSVGDDVAGALAAGIRPVLIGAAAPDGLDPGVMVVPDVASLRPSDLANRHP